MEKQITNSDLEMVVSIIDACSQRGAFKGEELMSVGALRHRILSVLKPAEQPEQPE
jgi:hypothetical protein